MTEKKNALLAFGNLSTSSQIELINKLLDEKSLAGILLGLAAINQDTADALSTKLINLAYDWRPSVRVGALQALVWVDTFKISDLIRDSLQDTHPDVFRAAVELYHLKKKIAA